MGKHLNSPRRSARTLPRTSFTFVVVAIAVLAIGAMTVVSRQKLSGASQPKSSVESQQNASPHLNEPHVHFQTQNGQIIELTPDEAARMASGLKQLVNQSTEDLVEVHHADGSVSVTLDDHFQNVSVARVNRNGSLAQSCVDNPGAAGAFFGIDPKLIENAPKKPATVGRSEDQ